MSSPGTSDKTRKHISEIDSIEWQTVDTEVDALFLEAELIKRYKPRYNIELKDDKSAIFVRIDLGADHPTVKTVRMPQDDGAKYFGPYLSASQIRAALRLLRPIYPFDESAGSSSKRVSLNYHLGLSPGLEEGKTSLDEYRRDLKNLIRYISGSRTALIAETEKSMKAAAKDQDFELAAKLRNQLMALKSLQKQIIFGQNERMNIGKDQALNNLSQLLGIQPPSRIECYDISHQSGTNNTASMVVVTNGVADRREYRKFKMRLKGNDDFAHMREVMSRRFAPSKLSSWPMPDLLVIDGGKGQVSSVYWQLSSMGIKIPIIGLAKRIETVIIPHQKGDELEFEEVVLGLESQTTKLLQRIRDEAHRFAITYHRQLKTKAQRGSVLDEIPGVGPVMRRKLLRSFGSVKSISSAGLEDLSKVVGPTKAKSIKSYLSDTGQDSEPAS